VKGEGDNGLRLLFDGPMFGSTHVLVHSVFVSAKENSFMDFNRILDGVIRAARFDLAFFNMVEKDTSYDQDALIVVIFASIASAIGAFLGSLVLGNGLLAAIGGLIWSVVWGIGAFYLLVFLVQWVGTQMFKGQGDFGEVRRCLGFAYGPRLLGIFAFIPCVGWLAGLAGTIWSAVAGFFALREALDQDNTNAILTIIVSWVIVIIIGAIFGFILAALGILSGAISGAF
jgi:hypothetical protein